MFVQSIFSKCWFLSVAGLLGIISYVLNYWIDISIRDLNNGFSHPLEGWDHIVTMLGVGIWAAQLRGRAIWLLPATFVGVMSLGGISGAAKYLTVPSAEILIILSCLVFSILILRKIRFDTKINVLIVAFFAFFHGYAHGAEISASASLISYTLGFMVATLLLHGAGILMVKVILLSMAFFIAQALHTVIPVTAVKTVISNCHLQIMKKTEQLEEKAIALSPHVTSTKSPPISATLPKLEQLKMYFVLCMFLFIFSISQFVCYVFYLKQRDNIVFPLISLAYYFKFSLYPHVTTFLTSSRLNHILFNLNSKGDFHVYSFT